MLRCIDHSIKCRVDVINNMKKYDVHPKHRYTLLKNLNYFRKLKIRRKQWEH